MSQEVVATCLTSWCPTLGRPQGVPLACAAPGTVTAALLAAVRRRHVAALGRVAPECDQCPDGLDDAEWAGSGEEAVRAGEGAAAGKCSDESAVATLQPVHDHHERDRGSAKGCEHRAMMANGSRPAVSKRRARGVPGPGSSQLGWASAPSSSSAELC